MNHSRDRYHICVCVCFAAPTIIIAPRPGVESVESGHGSSASWQNISRTNDGTRSGVATMPAESSASCAAPGQVLASTRRIAAASARRSSSSSWPSTPPVPQPSLCGSLLPMPCSPPDTLRAGAFVGRGGWDRASAASAESSCSSTHVAHALAPSWKPRSHARASARAALYSRSPSSLPSLVDRSHSSKAGASSRK